MNKINVELRTKTNEDLCALVFKLKMQLLEMRFKATSGELTKTHTIREIKKTISRCLSILKERKIDLSIGTHGVSMYDRTNNTVKSLTTYVQSLMQNKKIVENTPAPTTIPTHVVKEDESKSTPIVKEELKSNMQKKKADRTIIHKSVGGGS